MGAHGYENLSPGSKRLSTVSGVAAKVDLRSRRSHTRFEIILGQLQGGRQEVVAAFYFLAISYLLEAMRGSR
jgi:hypothetical protein